ncbi:MAG: hypothetical protein Q4F24_17015 [Eubacteriales bacterium]|nr:hypothetical protein [Eubacteriales bacterium]
MMMLNKDYMIGHMKTENGKPNTENIVFAAACEAVELFQCLIMVDKDFTDWFRFVRKLESYLQSGDYEKIHDVCQTLYAMKNLTEELEGLYLAREDAQICDMYYRVFVGMLDLTLFSTETMTKLNGGNNHE